MVVSTVKYVIPTYILGEAVGMPRWDVGRRDANTRNPVKQEKSPILVIPKSKIRRDCVKYRVAP